MVSISDNQPRRSHIRRFFLGRAVRFARRAGLWVKFEIALAVLAVISVIATYVVLSTKSAPFEGTSGTVRVLLLANLVLLSALGALIARRLVALWTARREGSAGSKLHGRFAILFSLVAIGPPIIMAIFTALFFEFGVQAWFSDKVGLTLDSSLSVAEAYIDEHRGTLEADVLAMAYDLNRKSAILQQNPTRFRAEVSDQMIFRSLSEAIVFDSTGRVLAKANLNLELAETRLRTDLVERANSGEVVILTSEDDDRVQGLVRLDSFFDAYLYVSRFVDPRVLGYVEDARAAVAEYRNLEGERFDIQTRFNVIFIIIALLILLVAVWIGLWFATRLVTPIGRLVEATERVSKGDLTARVPVFQAYDEIGDLSRVFNHMTGQLAKQRHELVEANQELDERRRFSEAVLSGVSAGVIGLKPDGTITLPNRSACELIDCCSNEVTGVLLTDVVPEMSTLFSEAKQPERKSAHGQISIVRAGISRTLLVTISAEMDADSVAGYVVTFDDVTEQLADQRTAAWADVARRIAHEIKNPLTPIQLSAERLRRKYKSEILSDPGVFDQCTETIVRQVGDLRRMVDEFSSFARMPAPVFRIEDIVDVVKKTVFLHEVGDSNVRFTMGAPDFDAQLVCDGRLIAQAVTNLLKNAAESIAARKAEMSKNEAAGYTGEINVKIAHDEKTTAIIIEDNGCGLPKDSMDRLTDPYVTTRAKGTGLGLAIVKKVMEDHGGKLVLGRRKNMQGARITLYFVHKELVQRSMSVTENTDKTKADIENATNAAKKVIGHGI